MAPSSRPDPFMNQEEMPGSSVRYSLDDGEEDGDEGEGGHHGGPMMSQNR